jgi:alanyl-tRNA synthetase
MNSSEIRSRFLEFFKKRGHTIIKSASLVTPDEKSVTDATLFNTAGMQPLVPYLLGKPYIVDGKEVKRLVNVQKCLRTVDIDDVGDKVHATFFEMLGNWSLGDYFKKEAIQWSYEFLTNPVDAPEGDRGLGLDPSRLYITVFEGDNNAPRDDEAADIWRDVFSTRAKPGTNLLIRLVQDSVQGLPLDKDTRAKPGTNLLIRLVQETGRVFYMPADKNWWEAGDNGPCGPDTEMYYDIGDPKTGKPFFGGKGITKEQFLKADEARQLVEVWNDVFMQYEKKDGKIIGNLPKPSVDTGAGLERLAMTLQGVDNIYDTDLFKPFLEKLKKDKNVEEYGENREKYLRIILDHTRAATFLIADWVMPSNTDRGYVLRKLIRRATDRVRELNLSQDTLPNIAKDFVDSYSKVYANLNIVDVEKVLSVEVSGYMDTLKRGIQKIIQTPELVNYSPEEQAKFLFDLRQSEGIPFTVAILEMYRRYGLEIGDKVRDLIDKLIDEHAALSRAGAEQKFKGGLVDANDPMVVRYHTATHLLQQALHDVLGEEVGNQKGSNITAERLRYDFTGVKLTDEQKKKVENIVNEKIKAALPVNQVIMSLAEAEKTGARHFFGEKYGDRISVYFIGRASNPPTADDIKNAYSKEFCGGPHVKNTSELAGLEGKWKFKIQKEEASSKGVRRIKAVLE